MRDVTPEEQQALRARYPKMDAHTEFIPTTQEYVELRDTQSSEHHLMPSLHEHSQEHTQVIELIPHDINGKIMRVYYSEKLNKCWVLVH